MARTMITAPPRRREGKHLSNGSKGKYRAALGVHDLRSLVLAFVVDGAASWSYNVVLIAYVFERTHSATWITGAGHRAVDRRDHRRRLRRRARPTATTDAPCSLAARRQPSSSHL